LIVAPKNYTVYSPVSVGPWIRTKVKDSKGFIELSTTAEPLNITSLVHQAVLR